MPTIERELPILLVVALALVDADVHATATEWIAIGLLPITGYSIPLESLRGVRRW